MLKLIPIALAALVGIVASGIGGYEPWAMFVLEVSAVVFTGWVVASVVFETTPTERKRNVAIARSRRRRPFGTRPSADVEVTPPGSSLGEQEHPTKPICAYGVSKLAIENYLALHHRIEGISLRLGNPYGRYQLRGTAIGLIANFLNALHSGRALEIWGDGSVVRDYLHIDDLADAFVKAATNDLLEPGAYNVGSGTGRSINDIIEEIAHVVGERIQVRNVAGRGFDVPEIVLDSQKLKRKTGWICKVKLETGIRLLWESQTFSPDPAYHRFRDGLR